MRSLGILFISTLLLGSLQAQDLPLEQMQDSALVAYERADYPAAIQYYSQVAHQAPSADAYYNLGNAYYKDLQIGLAVHSYERALLLDPSHADATYNLKLLRERSGIAVPSEGPSLKSRLFGSRSADRWAILSIVFAFLSAALFFFYLRSKSPFTRQLTLIGAILSILACLLMCDGALETKDKVYSDPYAILTRGVGSVYSAPSTSATVLFELHAGSKMKVREARNGWSEIEVDAERIGWIPSEDLNSVSFPELVH